ncbi:MAG TPA: DegT/DnrJ/EryC1/StrS family aminotransferase [bacterium]|nr:DegT/DnrJ/EryC1/StrS family aminotransferase [bacterium]HPN45602.1 DegT/DnrJ/EryC1/StrS family aminotransferase [bacterium]
MIVNLSRPDITDLEINAVSEVLKTPSLSLGPKLPEFEEKMTSFAGTKHAIAVNSGTSGLHLCVRALGFTAGDEVITTSFSFIASANCLLFENVKPVFVDIDEHSYNIDPDQIEVYIQKAFAEGRGEKIKGILPVHVFGQPPDMQRIMQIANKYHLHVLEDSCEALGSEYYFNNYEYTKPDGVVKKGWAKAGTMGRAGVYAFYPNKQLTTGEGGIIITDDDEIAELCISTRNQGRNVDGKWLSHVRLGYNYRLSDINCALGIAQMERVHEILTKRDRVGQLYNEKLMGIKGITIPFQAPNNKWSRFVYVIRLDDDFCQDDRNRIMQGLIANGIGSNNYFPPIHLQPFYTNSFGYKRGDLPVTERIADRTLALPFYNNLQEKDIDLVCNVLQKELEKVKKTR